MQFKNTVILLFAFVLSFSAMAQNRLSLANDIELSTVEGSVIVTNGSLQQEYLIPGAENEVLAIIGGVPTWSGTSGEMTTVTDQANGLDINLTGFDITIDIDIPELSTTTVVPADDFIVFFSDVDGTERKTNFLSVFNTINISDLNDVPDKPTGTTYDYLLQWNDVSDTLGWVIDTAYGGAGGGGTTIYSGNSSLSSDRVVTQGGYSLSFDGGNIEFNTEFLYKNTKNQLLVGNMAELNNDNFRLSYITEDDIIAHSTNGSKYAIMRNGNFYSVNASAGGSFVGEAYGGATNAFYSFVANGTPAVTTSTLSGDLLFNINASGYGSTTWNTGNTNVNLIQGVASETYTDAANGKELIFRTIENGGVTGDTSLYLHNNGDITAGDDTLFWLSNVDESLRLRGTAWPEGNGLLRLEVDDSPFKFVSEFISQTWLITGYSDTNANAEARITFRKARGTEDAPATVEIGDKVFENKFRVWHDFWINPAEMQYYVRDTAANGNQRMDMVWRNLNDAGTATRNVFTINEYGYLEFNLYGAGSLEAADVGLIESNYVPHFATVNGTIIDRKRAQQKNVWYVDGSGADADAKLGDPFRAGSRLESISDSLGNYQTMYVYPDTYADSAIVGFRQPDTAAMYFIPKSTVNIDAGSYQFFIADDSDDGLFTTFHERDVVIDASGSDFYLNSASVSIPVAIGMYHYNSSFKGKFGTIDAGTSGWGFQAGCRFFDLEIDKLIVRDIIAGTIAIAPQNGSDPTSDTLSVGAYHNVKIGRIEHTNNDSESQGSIRMQLQGDPSYKDATIRLQVDYWDIRPSNNGTSFIMIDGMDSTSTGTSVDFFANVMRDSSRTDNYDPDDSFDQQTGGNTAINIQSTAPADSNGVFPQTVTVNANFLRTGKTIVGMSSPGTLIDRYYRNSNITVKIQEAVTDSFNVFRMSASDTYAVKLRNTIVIFEGNFIATDQTAIVLNNVELDADSKIIFKGRFETKGTGKPVVFLSDISGAGKDNIIFENCTLINDGTSAAITANTTQNVKIYNSRTNSTATDADVTELVDALVKNANVD